MLVDDLLFYKLNLNGNRLGQGYCDANAMDKVLDYSCLHLEERRTSLNAFFFALVAMLHLSHICLADHKEASLIRASSIHPIRSTSIRVFSQSDSQARSRKRICLRLERLR